MSWQQLLDEASWVAGFIFDALDGQQQKVVSLLLSDSWQFVVAYFGITLSGNIAMPVDITFKKLEIDFVTGKVNPELVIAGKATRTLLTRPVVLIEDILAAKTACPRMEYRLPPSQQIATLFLSSGTTGRPKPIPNTHQNQLWDIEAISKPYGWRADDSLLITLHLAHRHGLVICLLGALYHGNTVYLEERFDPARVLQILSSGKVSFYSTVPLAYEKLTEFNPREKFDLSSMRLFASSSSPLPPYLAERFKSRFGHDILDRYGTSETGSIAIRPSSSAHDFSAEPLAGVKVRIETGGEVAILSPGLFPGYYKNLEATKKSLTQDGWWLTGDLGEIKDGRLILRGRAKERIQKSGYSIYPQDIEWALKQSPGVTEVKVTHVETSSLDDKIFAFFSGQASKEDLIEYSRLNLPRSWRPDEFLKLKSIPKTANGKPQMTKLRSMLPQADHDPS